MSKEGPSYKDWEERLGTGVYIEWKDSYVKAEVDRLLKTRLLPAGEKKMAERTERIQGNQITIQDISKKLGDMGLGFMYAGSSQDRDEPRRAKDVGQIIAMIQGERGQSSKDDRIRQFREEYSRVKESLTVQSKLAAGGGTVDVHPSQFDVLSQMVSPIAHDLVGYLDLPSGQAVGRTANMGGMADAPRVIDTGAVRPFPVPEVKPPEPVSRGRRNTLKAIGYTIATLFGIGGGAAVIGGAAAESGALGPEAKKAVDNALGLNLPTLPHQPSPDKPLSTATQPVTVVRPSSTPAATAEGTKITSEPDVIKTELAKLPEEQTVAIAQGQNIRFDQETGQFFADIKVGEKTVSARFDPQDFGDFGGGWIVNIGEANNVVLEYNPDDTGKSSKTNFRELSVTDQEVMQVFADWANGLYPGDKQIKRIKVSGRKFGTEQEYRDAGFDVIQTNSRLGGAVTLAVRKTQVGSEMVIEVVVDVSQASGQYSDGADKKTLGVEYGVTQAVYMSSSSEARSDPKAFSFGSAVYKKTHKWLFIPVK